jgi:phosphoserine phosphatase
VPAPGRGRILCRVITVPSGTPPAAAPVRPPLVVADLEGTCTSGETWRAVGRWLVENGRRGRYRRFMAPRLLILPLVRLGVVPRQAFRDRWIRDLAGLLDGLTQGELDQVARQIVEDELWPKRRVAVVEALEAAAAEGARVVIASGTYEPMLAWFVARLAGGPAGPVIGLGTPLEMAGGRTTGRLAGRVGTGSLKADRVAALAAGAPVRTAFGDSVADVPLLELAAEAIAVAPERELRALATARGWRILDDFTGAPR